MTDILCLIFFVEFYSLVSNSIPAVREDSRNILKSFREPRLTVRSFLIINYNPRAENA